MATDFQYRLAAHIIHQGGVIACPTDTIYGLACNPFDFDAVTRVMQVKRRVANKNFILLTSSIQQAESLIVINDQERERILDTTRPTSCQKKLKNLFFARRNLYLSLMAFPKSGAYSRPNHGARKRTNLGEICLNHVPYPAMISGFPRCPVLPRAV